jgi:hypothetical protein
MRAERESGGSARTEVLADSRDLNDTYQTSVLHSKNRLDPSSISRSLIENVSMITN